MTVAPTPNWNLVPVRGRYVNRDATVPTGTITFVPETGRAVDTAADLTILSVSFTAPIMDGAFEILLPATDDPDITPVGGTYKVTENIPGGSSYSITVPLAKAVDGIDLATWATVPPSAGTATVTGVTRVEYDATITDIRSQLTALEASGGAGTGGVAGVASVNGRTGVVTLTKTDVGLSAVDNTSDLNKPISSATSTALAGKAAASHTHAATDLVSGVIARPRLGTGTADGTTFLRGDGTWATPPAATAPVSSVNGQTGAVTLDAADLGALPDTYTPDWASVSGKPAVIAAGADAASARAVIGAGTSSLALGATASTAMPGNKTAVDLGGVAGTGITQIVKLTQAAYDALATPDSATLYVIAG